MPILQLKLTPAVGGITNVVLDDYIVSQELTLRKAVIVKNNTSTSQKYYHVFLPFIAGIMIHTNVENGLLTLPNDPTQRITQLDFNLKIGADNIQPNFNAKILDEDRTAHTETTNLNSIILYFDYKTNDKY
tara:strand:+ start:932 stop:1324 length:393 start_codon:yes stop_codon:yes gene_type:complete